MSSYEPLCVFTLDGGGELFRIQSLAVQPREGDLFKYEGKTYKAESVLLELGKKGPLGDRPAFWNVIVWQVVISEVL